MTERGENKYCAPTAGRLELVEALRQAIRNGSIDMERASRALDVYDAELIGEYVINQTIVRPRFEGYGQLVPEPDDVEMGEPDGAA